MPNPCIYTLKDGRQLSYEELKQHMLDNYESMVSELPSVAPKEEGAVSKTNKSLLTRLYESDNISDTARNKFKEEGLKYSPQSKEEARNVAKGVIDTFGLDEAVSLAEARRFGGGINSSVFAQALDSIYEQELQATTNAEKRLIQERWADIAIRYDEWSRNLGRDIAQIDDFYRRSPMGVIMAEQAKRDESFKKWFSDREKPYKELFESLKNDPEFKEFLKEEGLTTKAEKSVSRMKRRKSIETFFDSMKADKGVMYSTIIPPSVWNGAVEVMKNAILAGESVYAVIEKGLEHIRANHSGAIDENKFKEDWENKLFAQTGVLNPADKILAKFDKKMKGLTEAQKRDLVRKAAKELIESGGLEYDRFKSLLADVAGYGKMSKAESDKIEGLVKKLNDVDNKKEEALKNRTPQSIKDYLNSVSEAEKAATELSGILHSKSNPIQTLASIMQLNTLGAVSLIKNISYNFWWQTLGRFPKAVIMAMVDNVIYGATKVIGKPIKPEYAILKAQTPFFSKLIEGSRQSLKQVVTGTTNKDYFQKEIFTSQLRPYESLKDVVKHFKGEKKFSNIQLTDKVIKATFGVPAEVVARLLNVGDKPLRFAGEGTRAEIEARRLGVKPGIEMDLFVSFPKEEAYRILKERGMSDEKAMAEAEVVERQIIREGEEAVFQQDNLINNLIKNISNAANNLSEGNKVAESLNSVRKLVGTATMPFVKTPLNVGWHFINLVSPELSLTQSVVYGVSAAYKKAKGDPSYRLDLTQSKKWLAHAGLGLAAMSLYSWMQSINAVSGGDERAEKETERKAEKTYKQQRSINVSKIKRVLSGGDAADKEGDLITDLSWFGAFGGVMNAQANKTQNMTEEQRKEGLTYMEDLLARMDNSVYEAIEQGIFNNQVMMLRAMMDRNASFANQYAIQLANMGMNIVQPATFAQLSKAEIPYDYKIRADSFMEQLDNSIASRSSLYRKLTDKYPPKARNIWGEVADRRDPPVYRVFGMSKLRKDNFAQPLYNEYEKTGNLKLFPPAVEKDFTYNNQKIELNTKQLDNLTEKVGQERKKLLVPFLNNQSQVYVQAADGTIEPKYFNEITDQETKVRILQTIYSQGYEQGKINFVDENKSLFPELNIQEKYTKDQLNRMNNMLIKYSTLGQ